MNDLRAGSRKQISRQAKSFHSTTSTSASLTMLKPLTVWITINCGKFFKRWELPDHLTCFLRNLYIGQEATVRTGHGTMDWFQIGKGVRQGCILLPCLFNFYAEYAAAAAAASLQSCLTLCDPIDGSPPGSPVPGILQARTLEWVAISFSNYVEYITSNSRMKHKLKSRLQREISMTSGMQMTPHLWQKVKRN